MLEKIEGRYGRTEQVEAFVKEAERMIQCYGWEREVVHPYSYAMPITQIIGYLKYWDVMTSGSRDECVFLANGLVPILNAWEDRAEAPKVAVRIKSTGKVVQIPESDLAIFEGLYELI